MEIKSSKPLTLSEVNDILLKRKEEGELGYEQSHLSEYCEKFVKKDVKAAQKLAKELMKASNKINEETAVKIADIAPKKADTLKAILLKDKIELNEEELNEILKLLE